MSADGDNQPGSQSTPVASTSSQPSPENTGTWTAQVETLQDRSQVLSQARAFLVSPQIIHQSTTAKRYFLAQKGLSEHEITTLLQQMPPSLPPPTYPQPPPSRLPALLLGFCKLLSWVFGTASVLLFIYHRFLLPRVLRTVQARVSLKQHQISLLKNLNTKLETYQEEQREAFSTLPPPLAYQEPAPYASCSTLENIASAALKAEEPLAHVPTVSLLRCAIAESLRANEKKHPTAEQVFERLEASLPWKEAEFEIVRDALWETLTTSPLFKETSSLWSYNPPPPPASALVDKMNTLSAALPERQAKASASLSDTTPAQRTLQSLTAFTGYLSSQIYIPPRYITPGLPASTGGGVEEDIRKEIRALKGLALNRRSFLPPRPASAQGA